jgi:tetratricopeptide (TPR) repeat protein
MKKLSTLVFIFLNCVAYNQTPSEAYLDAFGKFESGAYKDAIEAFNRIIAINDKFDQKVALYKGIAEYRTGDYAVAGKDLLSLAEKGNAEANFWIASTYACIGNKKDALLYIERYLRQTIDPAIEEIKKDTVFKFLHKTDEWFELWQNDWLSDEQKAIIEAGYYTDKKDFTRAHQIIDNKLMGGSPQARLYAFNSTVYAQEDNIELALNEINSALALELSNTNFLKQRAGYLQSLCKYSEALSDLNLVLDSNPEDFTAHFNRARAAFGAKQLEVAKNDILLYLKYFSSAGALYLAAQIFYASEEYFKALKYFNLLIKDQKPDALYYRGRGLTYYQTRSYEFAAYDLSMSLDLDPNNAEANLYLGLSEYNKGNNKSACYYLKRAKNNGELKAIEYLQKFCKN